MVQAKVYTDETTGIIEYDVKYNAQNVYWQEAMYTYEKVLKSNPATEDYETAVAQIMQLYCRIGEYEKAKALANSQDSLIICKEVLLPLAAIGEEKAQYQGERLMALLSKLRFAVLESIFLRPDVSSSEYGEQMLLSVINLYETVLIDGRCGIYHLDIGQTYMTLAHYAASHDGQIDTALDYFDKGFDHYKKYQNIYNEEEYCYSAPLVSNLKIVEKGILSPIAEDFWKKELKNYPQNICDELRKNEKYAEYFAE